MSTNFADGLLIAAIGMGLVFLALILLWGLMALMSSIRFKSDHKDQVAKPAPAKAAEFEAETGDELRMRAAAAAVATSLALQGQTAWAVPPAPQGLSPWQISGRSTQFSQNSMVITRKPRGSAR